MAGVAGVVRLAAQLEAVVGRQDRAGCHPVELSVSQIVGVELVRFLVIEERTRFVS